ncbi:MAG: hypothetical protein PHF89_07425 [Eubacteriales bacterium]|jgi:hypothetical protein|nr:hypothetical protein [Eubacteriales bacterium]
MKAAKALKDKRLFAILAAALVRMGYLGFAYYPLLDDYIQYGIYPWVENPFREVYLDIGLFAARPIASPFDIYLWGRFWGNMAVPFFIITVLHAISAYVFILAFRRINMPLGMVFVCFYVLCPINIEGSYWISASSRIIVGMFFTSLSAYCLAGKKHTGFFIFQILAMFLYEQVAVFSFTLSFLIIYYLKDRRAWYLLALNMALFLLYYKAFSHMGRHGERAALTFFNIGGFLQHTRTWAQWGLFSKGFSRGVDMTVVYYIPVFAAAALLGVAESAKKFRVKQIWAGAVLFIAPYLPFLVLGGNHASFRTAFVPLFGLAVALDGLFNIFKYVKPALVVAISLFFTIVSISELCDYQQNYFMDRRIVNYVAKELDKEGKNTVVGAKDTYIELNVLYAEHIKSIASSDWALTGALREHLKDRKLPMVQFNPENIDDVNLISLYDMTQ